MKRFFRRLDLATKHTEKRSVKRKKLKTWTKLSEKLKPCLENSETYFCLVQLYKKLNPSKKKGQRAVLSKFPVSNIFVEPPCLISQESRTRYPDGGYSPSGFRVFDSVDKFYRCLGCLAVGTGDVHPSPFRRWLAQSTNNIKGTLLNKKRTPPLQKTIILRKKKNSWSPFLKISTMTFLNFWRIWSEIQNDMGSLRMCPSDDIRLENLN